MHGTGGIGQSRLPGSIFLFSAEKSGHGGYQEGKRELHAKPSTGDRASQSSSDPVKRGPFRMQVLLWFIDQH